MKDMQYYVRQEPAIYKSILDNYKTLFSDVDRVAKSINVRSITIYATGSSSNAAYSALPYMANILNVPVTVIDPSYAASYLMQPRKNDLAIAISQGGHSYSTIKLVETMQNEGRTVFTLTSDMASPIAKVADNIINMGMPVEEMPYVTAGYSATILDLMLLALTVAHSLDIIGQGKFDNDFKEISRVVGLTQKIVDQSESWSEFQAEQFAKAKRVFFIGYGATYGVAREGQTKFTETVHLSAFGNELEEYMHGPYIGLKKDDIVVFVDGNGKLEDRVEKLRTFLKAHVDDVISLNANTGDAGDLNFEVETNELLTSLFMTIPIHLTAFKASQIVGHDLTKSTYPDFDQITNSKI
ncbi:SIS domain-containing protein [Lacticaseibacillus manihotivorans]|uniref:Sugar isomerase n=1 Tax=Lacticaseibacillus manihotivorans DSM 13343 = JCM 12514 TaxID=1423769 RepID=A0A0R1R6X0_9LACO|nr:SIS domain-containing protein [Lacticaseibacillus manihotivorans]KRL52441.1 sugar isomerase [Lacticaseibacillus manihotivorans DSM 13343 = JCM 12514]